MEMRCQNCGLLRIDCECDEGIEDEYWEYAFGNGLDAERYEG